MPKTLQTLGYEPTQIGILLALAPLMRFATPFLFLKHIKLTKILFQSILILSILSSSLFYVSIYNFWFFLFNNAILGICLSVVLPYMEVIALTNLGKNLYGKSRLFGSIGFMLIALVLAKINLDETIVINYYLVTTIATVVFSFLLLNYDTTKHNSLQNDERFSLLKYLPFWVSLFLMQVSFGGFYNFFTIYETQHQISIDITSYLWSFGVICEILMLYFQAPLLKFNLLNIIKFSIAITIIRWLLLYLYPSDLTISFISQSIHAFSFGLYHSAVIIYLYKIYANKQLAQQFMLGIAYGLGGFMGSLVAGYSYGENLYLVSGVISFFSLIVLFNIKEQK